MSNFWLEKYKQKRLTQIKCLGILCTNFTTTIISFIQQAQSPRKNNIRLHIQFSGGSQLPFYQSRLFHNYVIHLLLSWDGHFSGGIRHHTCCNNRAISTFTENWVFQFCRVRVIPPFLFLAHQIRRSISREESGRIGNLGSISNWIKKPKARWGKFDVGRNNQRRSKRHINRFEEF